MQLTCATRSIWAKTGRHDASGYGGETQLTHWLPLHRHLSDTAATAAKLWDQSFWAPAIRRRLTDRYDGDEAAARAVAILLAENHDVGKASPAFAVQCPELTGQMGDNGLKVRQTIKDHPDRALVRHELVSYLSFLEWAERRGAGRDARQQLASVLGAHHGRPLTSDRIALARERPALVGEGPWSEARFELLDRAASNPEVMPHLSKILSTVLHQSDLVLLSGMLILADWLASSEAYFPLFPLGDDLEVETSSRMAEAWRRFAPSHGWTPNPAGTTAELFRERFQLPSGASPHPAQSELVDCARSLEEPGLLILEAPMGSGKTEAALAAAEVLAAKFGANGLFIALPTQATSNGMFTRVHDWADSSGMGTSIFLAHGRSTMNDEFEELVAEPRFNGVDESGGGELRSGKEPQNDGSVMVHRWFSGSKKGPLSNLVVGTIDQVLFAALQSRHVSVRHLALAGKVVVIDEVHAYDTYMGEFLTRAVQWLGAYGVPVVLLSATLPAERRQDLVRAYEEGRRLDRGERVRSRGRSMIDDSVLGGNIGYPVISASTELGQPRLPGWTGRRQNFAIERLDDGDGSGLVKLLRERMVDGGCVAVVHNTVSRAQLTAARLRAAFPDTEVVLAHSRFIAEDRARRDRELLDRFGSQTRAIARPERAIVVATQVIEQSLDLDFDLMISDIAPIDLLLQRTGRLHRHVRALQDRPSSMRSPRLIIMGAIWGEDPPMCEGGSRAVYGDHLLLRTLAELAGLDTIRQPDEIAPMVQRVYSEYEYPFRNWQDDLLKARRKFERERDQHQAEARPFLLQEVSRESESLLGWAEHAIGDAEGENQARRGRAMVRRSGESIEVFALFSHSDTISVAPWWGMRDGALPLNGMPDRALVRGVLRSVVNIPEFDCARYGRTGNRECQGSGIDLLISDIEHLTMKDGRLLGLQQAKELRGELMVVFDSEGRCRLPHATLHYSERDGLRVEHDG